MALQPFRFVHASDLRLDLPPQGLLEIPPDWESILRDAAFLAAERVFDTALAAEVDALLLAGDVFLPEASGLRGPLFLIEQFERLAEQHIQVFWSGGAIDPPEAWPSPLKLPANVVSFPRGAPTQHDIRRRDLLLASIVGCSRDPNVTLKPSDFAGDDETCTIALINGQITAEQLAGISVDYWALGGNTRREALALKSRVAQYSGSPQGRAPDDDGAHGCLLVEVPADGPIQSTFESTDVLRWYTPRVSVEPHTTREQLEQALRTRLQGLLNEAGGCHLLVNWTISGDGPLCRQIRRGRLGEELLDHLRNEFRGRGPRVWSNALEVEPPARFAAARYQEQTIQGDFLRQVRGHQEQESLPLNLSAYLEGVPPHELAAHFVTRLDAERRQRVLRSAAALGRDLLGEEEVDA